MAADVYDPGAMVSSSVAKRIRHATLSVRRDIARHAIEALAPHVPVDEPPAGACLGALRSGRPVSDDDYDALDELATRYKDRFRAQGAQQALRQYWALDTLSWALIVDDDDDTKVNFSPTVMAVGAALSGLDDDEPAAQSLLAYVEGVLP
jgi:hypothetical protein